MFYIPPALVLGCNNPVSLNPLKDWIEEATGFTPDFEMSGYSDGLNSRFGGGYGFLDGDGNGVGNGVGNGNGDGSGDIGCGHGGGFGNGYGYGRGGGCGNGY